jgi:hypothetical protein
MVYSRLLEMADISRGERSFAPTPCDGEGLPS